MAAKDPANLPPGVACSFCQQHSHQIVLLRLLGMLESCRLGEKMSHYAYLLVAENPVEAHREYQREQRRRSSIVTVGRL